MKVHISTTVYIHIFTKLSEQEQCGLKKLAQSFTRQCKISTRVLLVERPKLCTLSGLLIELLTVAVDWLQIPRTHELYLSIVPPATHYTLRSHDCHVTNPQDIWYSQERAAWYNARA